MKIWKKVYLVALTITTSCIQLGFLGIIYVTYQHMLTAEKERCEVEYQILRNSISEDIAQMEQSVSLDETYFKQYIKAYNSYYETDTQLIGMISGKVVTEQKVYENLPLEEGIFLYEEEQTTIYIAQVLDTNHLEYRIIMRQTLNEFDKIWATLWPLYSIGGIFLSVGESLLLAIVVRMVLKPMDKLEIATKEVQAGNWSARAEITGNSELTQLGNQFDAMAETVEMQIETLKQQTKQKQELIDNLAHEMNTPITSIQGFADYMRMSELSKEEEIECLEFILSESIRLQQISDTLLSMACIQNKEELLQSEFNIKQLCKKLEKVYQKLFSNHSIILHIYCEINMICGNEVLMESLLRNLLTNAFHAVCEKETATIKLCIFSEEKETKIQVSDNGCGIEENDLEQIFEPFYRVDKARSREHGGSGLGLAFCKKIVEIHNGTIRVESKVGIGTTFLVVLKED